METDAQPIGTLPEDSGAVLQNEGVILMSGKVCLTFDDGVYTQWIPVLPLFAQHRAHATFFFSGTVDDAMLDAMKTI